MPFSGHILEEVLKRRLQEEERLQQERRAAEELAMRRQEMANLEAERQADREYRQAMLERSDASALDARLEQGPISEEAATTLGKSPITAPGVQRRQVIDASPITSQGMLPGSIDPEPAGAMPGSGLPVIDAAPRRSTAPTMMSPDVTATTDTSGPQNYPVRLPTPQQAREALQETTFDDIIKNYERAATPQQRRVVQLQAVKNKTPLPESVIGETPEERQKREDVTWGARNTIEHRQRLEEIGAQTAGQMRVAAAADEAKKAAAKGDPAAKEALRNMALDAATKLKASPGLKDFTGWKGSSYAFGASEDPLPGTAAATAKPYYDSLIALLAVDNLALLKGPMSDKDILFIKAMSASLQPGMKDEAFVASLNAIIERLKNPTGEGWGKGGEVQRGGDVGPDEFSDPLARLEAEQRRRRGQR